MKIFLRKILSYLVLIYLLNLLIGFLIEMDNKKKADIGVYYPPRRWHEFYEQPKNSIDVVFLGASLCYKGYIPTIFNRITGFNSFNMGSSIQTVTTSYFVLEEVIQYQKPKVVFLELFTRALTYEDQIESVRYNFNYMRMGRNKWNLFRYGLSGKEKVEFLFPAYYKRDQLDRIVKYAFSPLDTSKVDDLYYSKGYVKSKKRISEPELNSDTTIYRFNWRETDRLESHLNYLQKIITLCKENNIQLILLNSPLPSLIYNKIDIAEFENMLFNISESKNIRYLNLNKENLGLIDTLHFEDQHLNYEGAVITTTYLSNYFKQNIKNPEGLINY
jgi:hypothetical protein